MVKKVVGTLTEKEYSALNHEFAVTPEKYTKPIRMYVDVDGVVAPFVYSEEDYDMLDGRNTLQVVDIKNFFVEPLNIVERSFVYRKKVVQKLSEWSHRDDIDFVWLTSWRFNAPYALDKIMNIKSVGYLPWERHKSDYIQSFKRIAIEGEQKLSPSKFVWLDDFANEQRYPEIPVFTEGYYEYEEVPDPNGKWDDFLGKIETTIEEVAFIEEKEIIQPDQYLSLTTKSYLGLTDSHISMIDVWLNKQK